VHDGIDPIAAKKANHEVPTFGDLADKLITDMSSSWRNDKHKAQWTSTLKTHAADLRPLKVDAITTAHVLSVLTPIWAKTPETATRVRGRIEAVLNAAKAKGYRTGENPAAWRGHLDHLLPARKALSRGHHKALAFHDLPAFMAELRSRDAVAALALEFTILTAARSGEALGARKSEIDRKAAVWIVPAERMKAGKEHRVPLSGAALAVLDKAAELSGGELVFPGSTGKRPLSAMAMAMLLRRMEVPVTVHGFRSTFRDWAGELTAFPRELAEAALAHTVGDKVEQAYRRGDALEKRRKLMEAWANYCAPKAEGNVRVLGRAK
jgi:integrase